MPDCLTDNQKDLIKWLGEDDYSLLGECDGPDLTYLVDRGLAEIKPPAPGRAPLYSMVSLTAAGLSVLAKLPAILFCAGLLWQIGIGCKHHFEGGSPYRLAVISQILS